MSVQIANRLLRVLRPALAGLMALAGVLGLTLAQTPGERHAVELTLDGAVSPATADYLIRGIRDAGQDGAELIIIRMDTPGGLETSMRDIIKAIMASSVPVATHVAPGGARAASAGAFILYASHIAAMAPGTAVGAATPVAIGGGANPLAPAQDETDETTEPEGDAGAQPARTAPRSPGSASEAKAINDAVALIRGLAEERGRNPDLAEAMVREAVSLSASAALADNVIDFVARDRAELLAQAHGREVTLDGVTVVLDTEGLSVVERAPDWRTQLLAVITNPNIAVLLMALGFYGILFELYNPGTLVPGTIGAISLLTGMFALSILPFNFAGLALIGLGLVLIIAEAFSPSFGILGIGGTAAVVFGAVLLFDSDIPGLEMSWPALAALAVATAGFSLMVARMAVVSHRRRVGTGSAAMVGLTGRVTDWDGRRGHVFVHGERWQARAGATLVPGQGVLVTAIDGLTLMVEPAGNDKE